MPVDLLKNITDTCPQGAALLGLDVGKKTIGLALCDPDHRVATPLHTIKRVKFSKDLDGIFKIINEFNIGGFVVGLPVNMDESEGPRAQSVRDFALEFERSLKERSFDDIWIALWDERLSTVSVEGIVDGFVGKKSKRRGAKDSGLVDKLAAQLILQGALDFLANHKL